jgi:parvulin-like peptidyl-prolyl isomerase
VRHPHPAARLTRPQRSAVHRHRSVERRARRALRVAAGACALLLASVVSAAAGTGEAEVVARVNGTPITQSTVNQVVKSLILARGSTPNSDEIGALNDAALDSLIDLELLFEAAQQASIQVTDQDVQAEIARGKARVGGDKAFAAALQHSGMTEAQLAADTRKTLMVDRFIEQRLTTDAHVTPDAVRRFYDEHHAEFQHDEQARISDLLVRLAPDAPAAARVKARQLADELHRQLHTGADFARFAKTYAVDDDAAARGGDRGFVERRALPPAVEQAAFSLPIGQVSDVLETPEGYHLIVVTERRPAGVVPFEEAQPAVEQTLLESDRRQRQQAYLDELRKTAKIERPTPAKSATAGR